LTSSISIHLRPRHQLQGRRIIFAGGAEREQLNIGQLLLRRQEGPHCDEARGTDGAEAYKGCNYSFCNEKGKHSFKVCPTLNHRCGTCLFRGHQAGTGLCSKVSANLALFEACAITATSRQTARGTGAGQTDFFPW
jgi:hypothetical protein